MPAAKTMLSIRYIYSSCMIAPDPGAPCPFGSVPAWSGPWHPCAASDVSWVCLLLRSTRCSLKACHLGQLCQPLDSSPASRMRSHFTCMLGWWHAEAVTASMSAFPSSKVTNDILKMLARQVCSRQHVNKTKQNKIRAMHNTCSCMLQVTHLKAFRQSVMHDKAHVWLIDPHSKGNGGTYHLHHPAAPLPLHLDALLGSHTSMIVMRFDVTLLLHSHRWF